MGLTCVCVLQFYANAQHIFCMCGVRLCAKYLTFAEQLLAGQLVAEQLLDACCADVC